jgi:hypothetical protein
MADDRVRKLAEESLNRLASELETGKSQALSGILEEILQVERLRNARDKQTDKPSAEKPASSHAEPGRPDPVQAPAAPQIPDAIDSISLGR